MTLYGLWCTGKGEQPLGWLTDGSGRPLFSESRAEISNAWVVSELAHSEIRECEEAPAPTSVAAPAPASATTGPGLYGEGLRFLALARDRAENLDLSVPLGIVLSRPDDTVSSLTALADAHFRAAAVALDAEVRLPLHTSWRAVTGRQD